MVPKMCDPWTWPLTRKPQQCIKQVMHNNVLVKFIHKNKKMKQWKSNDTFRQNPTSPSYRPVYWMLIDGGQTVPHSSCERCVQRAIHNMTFITTLRQHVLWFPCDVCRRRPGRARLHWSAVRLLLSDWLTDRCQCASAARPPLGVVFQKCFAAAYTLLVHLLKVLFPALWGSKRRKKNIDFSSKCHVNIRLGDFGQK